MDKLKFIKTIVFILTFLLVFGMLTAVGTIYKKVNAPKTLANINLNQPKGSRITDYRFDNGNIYILINGGGKADRIAVVNPASGKILATISTSEEQ